MKIINIVLNLQRESLIMSNKILSIDVGGTKTLICVFDTNLKILTSKLLSTHDYLKGMTQDLDNLFRFIKNILDEDDYHTIGVSFKGNVTSDHILFASLLGGKINVDVKKLIKKHFKFRRFIIDNDVFCMAKAEKKYGVGTRVKNFLLINVGTGLRLVNVIDGRIHRGYSNLAGEIGYKEVWEKITKTNQYFNDLVSGGGLNKLSIQLNGRDLSAKDIFSTNMTGLIEIFIYYVTELLIEATLYLNPEVVVFTGSLTKSYKRWLPEVIKRYNEKVFPDIVKPKQITVSKLKNSASLGAILYNKFV